jgi:hypothetical protein
MMKLKNLMLSLVLVFSLTGTSVALPIQIGNKSLKLEIIEDSNLEVISKETEGEFGLFALPVFHISISGGSITWDDRGFMPYSYGEQIRLLFSQLLPVPLGKCENIIPISGQLTSSARPVPEPQTMLLFGVGLIGMAAAGRKKFGCKT